MGVDISNAILAFLFFEFVAVLISVMVAGVTSSRKGLTVFMVLTCFGGLLLIRDLQKPKVILESVGNICEVDSQYIRFTGEDGDILLFFSRHEDGTTEEIRTRNYKIETRKELLNNEPFYREMKYEQSFLFLHRTSYYYVISLGE